MAAAGLGVGEIPAPAFDRHFGAEEQGQAGRIAVDRGGIVGNRDEGTADPAAARAGQREIKDVLVFSVLGEGGRCRYHRKGSCQRQLS